MWLRVLAILGVLGCGPMGHGFEHWSGDRPISQLERLGYERHVRDVESGAERGLWFDEEAADHVVQFFAEYLVFSQGNKWVKKPFLLSPWEAYCTRSLFGWMRLPVGRKGWMSPKEALSIPFGERQAAGILRRYDSGTVFVPRKNGKTEWAAGVGLYCMVADGEEVSEVYSIATKFEQAGKSYNAARRMVLFGPLSKVARPEKMSIIHGESFFQRLAADYSTLDALNPHYLLLDEVHAWKNRETYEVMTSSMGAQDQPLVLAISTAGEIAEGIGREEYEYAEKVVQGVLEDDQRFVFLAGIDPGDDWRDEEVWHKANPNWEVSVNPEKIRAEFVRAEGSPAKQNSFKRYYLNEWVNAAEAWMNVELWQAGKAGFAPEALAGRRCYGGLDLSRTTDLTALALLFPPSVSGEEGDCFWRALFHFWMPAEKVVEAEKRDRVPYRRWEDAGWLTTTPGSVVDYAFPEAAIRAAAKLYELVELGYDPYNATKFISDLESSGIGFLTETRQGPPTLSPAMKEVERLVLEGQLLHRDDPVMRWCVANTVAKEDHNGNIVPDKRKSNGRIDGVSALCTAMARAIVEVHAVSVYETRGILTV